METDFLLQNAHGLQHFLRPARRPVLLRELAAQVTGSHDNAAVFFAAGYTQTANAFATADHRINNRHGIFTWYFCDALKKRSHDFW